MLVTRSVVVLSRQTPADRLWSACLPTFEDGSAEEDNATVALGSTLAGCDYIPYTPGKKARGEEVVGPASLEESAWDEKTGSARSLSN